ncbi:MAG TPA: tetratricopeptide repeat protein [Longimicrobium sp.]|nr:tetratricopeptide repeat protein [Longimicrobium sp.]
MRRILVLLALVLLTAPAAAQPEPARPNLPRGADANDWEAYFDLGVRLFRERPQHAAAAFYWASRIDPTRAEPMLGRWASFYAADQGRWIGWVQDREQTVQDPLVLKTDSLLYRAYARNPFVHRGLVVTLYDMLPGRWKMEPALRAWFDYGRGEFAEAARGFAAVWRDNPSRNYWALHDLALSHAGAGQFDSASVALQRLLEALRADDQVRVVYFYESKAMHEYALGMLANARRDAQGAKAAFERALEEDFSTYPAHVMLARITQRRSEAVEHLRQAVDIAPDEGYLRYEYANALATSGRQADAIEQLQHAIRLEPHYADPYYRLATLHDVAGHPELAVPAYRAYLQRAPRKQAELVERVRARLAAIGGS